MVDNIITGKTRNRREFCSFYTESDPILTYMVKKLHVSKEDVILEPCAGDGIFLQKILSTTKQENLHIDALDINPLAIKKLTEAFNLPQVTVQKTDTLFDATLDLFANANGHYTKIIGNPPYGAWQEYQKRHALKRQYGGYVKETYTLFLKRCIDLLKDDGRLVFIVPDTFLALRAHTDLRKKILTNTKIEELLLMPSKFFPGVNFGYSNLCIITLVKSRGASTHKIRIASIRNSVKDLYSLANSDYSVASKCEEIAQADILNSIDYSFLLGGNDKIRRLINTARLRLGDIADCVTGFYSGDNRKFFAINDPTIKGAEKYNIVDPNLIEHNWVKEKNILNGLANGKKFIPILKGGAGRFFKDTNWFVLWDQKTVNFYKHDVAARFQNSQFYFKEGIGVPMVSSKIQATLLSHRLFDQSIVGIFPRNHKDVNYLLAFLNSNVCAQIMRSINHTANNSANYLKKLPVIVNDAARIKTENIVKRYFADSNLEKALSDINAVFDDLYELDKIELPIYASHCESAYVAEKGRHFKTKMRTNKIAATKHGKSIAHKKRRRIYSKVR